MGIRRRRPGPGRHDLDGGILIEEGHTGPANRQIDAIVLQLGVTDVAASKQLYLDHGMTMAKSYGNRYVELDTGPIKLTLNKRGALARTAGVSPDGAGPHRLVIGNDTGAFTDPDGFVWETPLD